MKNFVLIGASGYIAPRHMKAIKNTGNILIAAYDPHDAVGIIDTYFPNAHFFIEFERFDRHLEKLKRAGTKIDYVVISSPNYLHDSHIRYGLRIGADVVCEKPIVLNPWNLDGLVELENDSKNSIFSILQLRLHPSIIKLKEKIKLNKIYDVEITYITSRGRWYHTSWKGDEKKSGGLATNIGVHFFDMLQWIFGPYKSVNVDKYDEQTVSGSLSLEHANVNWFLSIDSKNLPYDKISKNQKTYRSIIINNEELEFSDGFNDLHTYSYEKILNKEGFKILETKPSIEIISEIRKQGN